MARTEVLTSIDIGTSKVSCLIAEADSNGNIDFVGHGLSPCLGLKRGALIDTESTVRAIEADLALQEPAAGAAPLFLDLAFLRGQPDPLPGFQEAIGVLG